MSQSILLGFGLLELPQSRKTETKNPLVIQEFLGSLETMSPLQEDKIAFVAMRGSATLTDLRTLKLTKMEVPDPEQVEMIHESFKNLEELDPELIEEPTEACTINLH